MGNLISTLSENPNLQEQSGKKQEIIKQTQEYITNEEFEKMSWEDLEKHIRVVDGNLTLFGKSLNYWISNLNIEWSDKKLDKLNSYIDSKRIIEQIKNQFKQKEFLIKILQIWTPEAQEISASVWFKGFREDDDIILKNIKKISEKLKIGVPIKQEILDKEFNEIFYLMINSEKQESIIGEDDLKKVKEIFFDKKIPQKEKEIKTFNLMRYGGASGNSEGVKNILANKLLKQKEFEKERKLLQNPKLQEFLEEAFSDKKEYKYKRGRHFKSENLEKLGELIGDKKLAKKLLYIYEQTQIKLENALKEKLKQENEKRKKNGEKQISFEAYKKQINFEKKALETTLDTFKYLLIEKHIDNLENRGSENESYIGIYANLTGLAEKKGIGDYFVFADENIDNLIDFGVTLAIGAITMGVGIGATIAGKAIFAGARMASLGNKVARIAKAERFFEAGTRTRFVSSFIGNATLDGITFYEGATLAQNLMFRDLDDLGHGMLDKNEIVKSIAFMGALNSLQFVSKIPGMKNLMEFKFGDKIPETYLKPKVIEKVLINTGNFAISGVREGTIMFGISGMIEELLGEGWHPTIEEYLHFVVLIQLMHLKNINIKKNPTPFSPNQASF